jgi:prepilin signal peptidase PulO-like enzyme (type II secretory pathway)
VGFGGILLILAVRRLRTYKLKERYALLGLLIGLPFVALAFWPNGIGWLAERLGIKGGYTTLALICVSVFLFLIIFELLTIVSVQDQKITALAQLVGILMQKHKLADPEHRPQDSADDEQPPARQVARRGRNDVEDGG